MGIITKIKGIGCSTDDWIANEGGHQYSTFTCGNCSSDICWGCSVNCTNDGTGEGPITCPNCSSDEGYYER